MAATPRQRALACIGLGSNLDDPAAQIRRALAHLAELPDSDLFLVSSLYRSAPLGPVAQPDFVNAVAAMTTRLTPRALLAHLKAAEQGLGRQPAERWGPRVIDLDLLVHGDAVVDEPDLVVPHPGIAGRNFVLLPLAEIAPDLVIPGLGPVADIPVSADEPRIERIDERTAASE
ncbi:MAG: 2-amino-4-hydroxy-6-hydroxymethyldihydropteridine diphosphokinase [Woeseiaceae bacterium]|nr:2-amino-4-hydroxy-6-hydroxymethyldihydropteridine diphosphokinase [Woeseiaceae bacterium]